MSKKKGTGKFIFGALLGAGAALLFAPEKGEVTRKKLKIKLDELIVKVKNIDTDEVKDEIIRRVNDIKVELAELDKERAIEIAKKQAVNIQKKAEELYQYAIKKGTPVLEQVTNEIKEKALQVAKDVVVKLEKEKTNEIAVPVKKKTTVKKKVVKK